MGRSELFVVGVTIGPKEHSHHETNSIPGRQGNVQAKKHEIFVVPNSHRIIDPRTMVVHLDHVPLHTTIKVRAGRLVNPTSLALPGSARVEPRFVHILGQGHSFLRHSARIRKHALEVAQGAEK